MSSDYSQLTYEEPPDRQKIIIQLEQQYPSLRVVSLPQAKFPTNILEKLVTYIRYSFPRFMYTQEIDQLQIELMEYYLQSQLSREFQSELYPLNQQKQFKPENQEPSKQNIISQTSSMSTEKTQPCIESKISIEEKEQEAIEFTEFTQKKNIVDIRNFLRSFSGQKNSLNLVSQDVKESITYINGLKKQKNCTFLEKKQEIKKKTEARKKSDEVKGNEISMGKVQNKNPEFSIILGDKIPLKTKLMRDEIKKSAEGSFAITSQLNEKMLSEIEKSKKEMFLVLNKVAQENLDEVFSDIQSYIVNSHLAKYFINQIIMKCKIEQKNIVFYVMLIERIEQIKRAMFEVEWRKSLTTKKKKNPFHIYLMEEVQKQFESFLLSHQKLQNQKKEFLGVCKMLGNLVKYKIFSKYVFKALMHQIMNVLFLQIQKSQRNEKIVENLVQSMIVLIETLGDQFQDISQRLKEPTVKYENIIQCVFSQKMTVKDMPLKLVADLLMEIEEKFITKTERIRCLLQNMRERKNKNPEKTIQRTECKGTSKSSIKEEMKDLIGNEKNEKSKEKLQKIKSKFPLEEVMKEIIKSIADGLPKDIQKNLQFIGDTLEKEDREKQAFKKAYQSIYDQLIYYDLPYLASSLAILILKLEMNGNLFIIRKEQSHEEFEEYESFADKLTIKLQYYAEVSNSKLTC